ncbi:TPA: DNA adenine methylase, partial [Aeromonas hydrophila]|nr:DNA adenine methylase [Aeromonas hydrophila]
ARHTAARKGVPVLISNHDIELTRELYRGARLDEILVKRTISRNGGTRNKVAELLALYPPGIEPEQGYYPSDAELAPLG